MSISSLILTSTFLFVTNVLAQSGSFMVVNVRVFDGEAVHPSTNVLVRDGLALSLPSVLPQKKVT